MAQWPFPGIPGNDPTVVSATDLYGIGNTYQHEDATYGKRTYMWVYLDDAVDAILGSVAEISDLGRGNVTLDRNGSVLGGHVFAGMHLGAVTATNYCFIVCGIGDRAFCSTAGSVASGDRVIVDPTNDKVAVSWAPTTAAATVAQLMQTGSGFGVFPAADATLGGTVVLIQGISQ